MGTPEASFRKSIGEDLRSHFGQKSESAMEDEKIQLLMSLLKLKKNPCREIVSYGVERRASA